MTLGDISDYIPTVGAVAGAIIATIIFTVRNVQEKLKSLPRPQTALQTATLQYGDQSFERMARSHESVAGMMADLLLLTRQCLAKLSEISDHGKAISTLAEREADEREIEQEVERRLREERRPDWASEKPGRR